MSHFSPIYALFGVSLYLFDSNGYAIYSTYNCSTIFFTTTLNNIQNHISFQRMYKSNVITICRENTISFNNNDANRRGGGGETRI